MENEKMQVNFAPGITEATLRVIELHEENELPVLEPDKVELAGTIGSVHEFLLKRISEKEQINQKRCYILVDRERMPLLWRQTNKWRNWKTLSFCGKNARIASRVR